MKYEDLLRHVNKYFYDTTRPASETKAGLQDLVDEIEVMIASIEPDEGS